MPRQYLRNYRLTVQNDVESQIITDLPLSFDITKDLIGVPNRGVINVGNLKKSSRDKIQQEFDEIILDVGYGSDLKTLFVAKVKNVFHEPLNPGYVTRIFAADGLRDYETSFSNFTLKENASLQDVLSRVVQDLPNTLMGLIEGVELTDIFPLGFSVSQPSSEVLDQLADEHDFTWFIEQEELHILDNNSVENFIINVSSDTGLLSSPIITERGADVSILLNPDATPGRIIDIQSRAQVLGVSNLEFRTSDTIQNNAIGEHKIIKANFIGDTYGQDWRANLSTQAIL